MLFVNNFENEFDRLQYAKNRISIQNVAVFNIVNLLHSYLYYVNKSSVKIILNGIGELIRSSEWSP